MTPKDWYDPNFNFNNLSKVHEWKRYISDEIQENWQRFTLDQRAMIARQAQEIADREEWD